MKRIKWLPLLLASFSFINDAFSQIKMNYAPENGYWVIVTNIHFKRAAVIQFYTNENQLIYEEKVTGKRIRVSDYRTLKCLNKGLDSALVVFEKRKEALKDQDWISSLLKNQHIH